MTKSRWLVLGGLVLTAGVVAGGVWWVDHTDGDKTSGQRAESVAVDPASESGPDTAATESWTPPTAIAEVIEGTKLKIACADGAESCQFPSCTIENPTAYRLEGVASAASGRFGASYGSPGFQLDDGTGGIFVATKDDLKIERGARVRVSGTTECKFGTLAVAEPVVTPLAGTGDPVFAPRQIGQLAKKPDIESNPEVTPNWCDCDAPSSVVSGQVLTVRGTAVADLQDDGEYGWKLFVDDGGGVAQIFIDAQSAVDVPSIRSTLLKQGSELCITGVVAHFAGVGYELLPRTTDDLRPAGKTTPCAPKPVR